MTNLFCMFLSVITCLCLLTKGQQLSLEILINCQVVLLKMTKNDFFISCCRYNCMVKLRMYGNAFYFPHFFVLAISYLQQDESAAAMVQW